MTEISQVLLFLYGLYGRKMYNNENVAERIIQPDTKYIKFFMPPHNTTLLGEAVT
jgi:hypothetical protein